MGWLTGVYAFMAAMALGNLVGMRRLRTGEGPDVAFLIPARDEAENLARLVPELVAQGARVYVFDDESSDGTAEAARAAGAVVLRGAPLPEGWTGKNRACHELAKAALEDFPGDWVCFLDADVHPRPGFVASLRHWAATRGRRVRLLTGFPDYLPGAGPEPLVMGWVGWVLLTTNPFWLVSRTGLGHNLFTNGQVQLWHKSLYAEHWPHEAVRGRILEDVAIGRLMARRGVPVEVVALTGRLAVRMYANARQALDGMAKNSYEIAGSAPGTVALALALLFVAWGWLAAPVGYLWLCGGFLFAALTCRFPLWVVPLAPITVTLGAFTLLRSLGWKATGRTRWKGRTYT